MKYIPDPEKYQLLDQAVDLLTEDVFSKKHYRQIASMVKNDDPAALLRFVEKVAGPDIDRKVIKGVCVIVLLAAKERGVLGDDVSDDFMLGRMHEFCMSCVDGSPNEAGQIPRRQMPIWLKPA